MAVYNLSFSLIIIIQMDICLGVGVCWKFDTLPPKACDEGICNQCIHLPPKMDPYAWVFL